MMSRLFPTLLLIVSLIIGTGCATTTARVSRGFPTCPIPTALQADALQVAILLDDSDYLGELEQRRVKHCCQLEVFKGTEEGDRCKLRIQDLSDPTP